MRTLFILCLAASLCPAQDAAALFAKHRASCHQSGSTTRAPFLPRRSRFPRENSRCAGAFGSMIATRAITGTERLSLATYLSGAGPVEHTESPTNACPPATFSMLPGESSWNGWGVDLANTRFQPAKAAGLDREKSARLKLKWASGFRQNTALAQPVVAGGRLFFGSAAGTVYSLDAKTGCEYWTHSKPPPWRAPPFPSRRWGGAVTYCTLATSAANVYALTRRSKLLWQMQVDRHAYARVSRSVGAALASRGRTAAAQVLAGNAKYACCTFPSRSSVAAL